MCGHLAGWGRRCLHRVCTSFVVSFCARGKPGIVNSSTPRADGMSEGDEGNAIERAFTLGIVAVEGTPAVHPCSVIILFFLPGTHQTALTANRHIANISAWSVTTAAPHGALEHLSNGTPLVPTATPGARAIPGRLHQTTFRPHCANDLSGRFLRAMSEESIVAWFVRTPIRWDTLHTSGSPARTRGSRPLFCYHNGITVPFIFMRISRCPKRQELWDMVRWNSHSMGNVTSKPRSRALS